MADKINRVVLAFSGGLDTSVILKWLQQAYGCEVVTFTADLGQGEELEPARHKAELMGIKPEHIFIDDLREEFVRDFIFPMMRANALYEGHYLLGTAIARPLGLAPHRLELFALAEIGSEGHHLALIFLLEPLQDHARVQPARIGEDDAVDLVGHEAGDS